MAEDSVCPLPTKEDDNKYHELLDKFAELGPVEDPMFKEALNILHQTSPSEAQNELLLCKKPVKGGRHHSRKLVSRKLKAGSRRVRRGGAGETVEETTSVAPEDKGRLKCYLRVMSKMALLVGGVGYAGYRIVVPFLTSSIGSPCTSWGDQMWGAFAGTLVDSQMSCSYRQQAYDSLVSNYLTGFAAATGIPITVALLKSPEIFGLVLKYLLAKECPTLYAPMTKDQLLGEWERIRGVKYVPPKTTTFVSAAPVYAPVSAPVASEVEAAGEETVANPDIAVPRRTTRRRGGRKHVRSVKRPVGKKAGKKGQVRRTKKHH